MCDWLQFNPNKKQAKGFIFVSEKYEEAEKLLVLVHGSGVVKAGQWARRYSSMIQYFNHNQIFLLTLAVKILFLQYYKLISVDLLVFFNRLIINDCLDHGTQLPYIRRGLQVKHCLV